jgi:TolB protein
MNFESRHHPHATRMIYAFAVWIFLVGTLPAMAQPAAAPAQTAADPAKELRIWKVPNMGPAAESYFSPDGKSLICNGKLKDDTAYQVYTLKIDGTDIRRINDRGDDACSFFFPNGKKLIWTSTRDHLDMPKSNYSDTNNYPQGAELYTSDLKGGKVKRLTHNTQYDAEVTVSPDGKWILFGRQTQGRMDLYRMRTDGSGLFQITNTPEWQEGGAAYMPDGKTILYRAWKIQDQKGRGMPMTIFTIQHDGTGMKQITDEPGTNWAPFPAPDGKHFAFVKLLPPGNFELFLMNMETRQQTRLTYHNGFDGFPSFSPDGKLLSFSSSRDAAPGERTLSLYLMDISSLGIRPIKKR